VEGTVVMQPPSKARATPPPIPPVPLKHAAPLPPPIPQAADAAAEPAAAVRRGVPIALLAGAAGLVLLAGAIAVGVLLMRRGGSAEPTPAPSVAATAAPTAPPTTLAVPPMEGTLHVETEPAGATVTVDGVVRGTSPVDVTGLVPGAHEVKIEHAGFADETQTVEISSAAPAAVLKLPLSKAGPAMGAADITTNPAGATVKVDGVSVGRTPLRNHRLRTGSRSVEASAVGYEVWTGKLTVREGRRAKLDILLKAIPKATPVPTPTPEVVDPSRVYEASQVDVAPRKLSGGAAAYPRGAPKLKGAVTVSGVALVTEAGDVADVRITESGGSVVDGAVVNAVRNWKFSPGVKKGVKVKVRVPFRQTFLPG
jgi:TonB family protein